MDVERIQKINTLAVDLMRQGLATDREDAVAQAERIYRSKDGSDGSYTAVRDATRSEAPRTTTTSGMTGSATPGLSTDQVSQILEQNTKFMVGKIKEFQDKITALESEIAILKTKATYSRPAAQEQSHSSSSAMQGGSSSSSSGQSFSNQSNSGSSNTSAAANHPRSGNYKEQDVSIEKFFYMGNKR